MRWVVVRRKDNDQRIMMKGRSGSKIKTNPRPYSIDNIFISLSDRLR